MYLNYQINYICLNVEATLSIVGFIRAFAKSDY